MLNTFDFPGKPKESKLQAIITWVYKINNRLEYLPELSTLIFQNNSTDSTPNEIFAVVGNGSDNEERLLIVQLNLERVEITSVGEIPYLNEALMVSCAGSIFFLGDWNWGGLVHEFDLVTRTARTPTQLEEPVRITASGHKVIISGEENKSYQTVATCTLFALATNHWTSLRQLRQARNSHIMCWLPHGRVFAIGGEYLGKFLSSVEMLERAWIPAPIEEASVEWENLAPMKTGRYHVSCCFVEG